jgi:hypothetical protein
VTGGSPVTFACRVMVREKVQGSGAGDQAAVAAISGLGRKYDGRLFEKSIGWAMEGSLGSGTRRI